MKHNLVRVFIICVKKVKAQQLKDLGSYGGNLTLAETWSSTHKVTEIQVYILMEQ